MDQQNEYENLARLGEELLKEFEAAEKAPVPAEFDRAWRHALRREKRRPVAQLLRWTAAAAVLAFALVGMLTVAALSVESLRTPLLRFAASYLASGEEVRLEEPEEYREYHQISYLGTDSVALEVRTDGNDNYQLLWANEQGLRLYNFHAPELDEEFFRDLGEQLGVTVE